MDTISSEDFAFQHSSPDSLRIRYEMPSLNEVVSQSQWNNASPLQHQNHDYNFSGVTDDEDLNDSRGSDMGIDDIEDDQHDNTTLSAEHSDQLRRQSGRSSISSFPASVSHEPSAFARLRNGVQTPSKTPSLSEQRTPDCKSRNGSVVRNKLDSPRSHRGPDHYDSPFRHPSSIRAMQMQDELFDDSDSVSLSQHRHRRNGSRMSLYSQRSTTSTQTSPSKKGSRTSAQKHNSSSKLRKEFPLVLLHCTLLPPAVTLSTAFSSSENMEDLIRELLPEEYARRWVMLHDRIMRNEEVRNRGVLISHPRDEYDLLEERLLESLELQLPRIRGNHYLPKDESSGAAVDSGFESAGSVTEDDAAKCSNGKVQCPDCGSSVRFSEENPERKWEVKVYAANGLMRSGAWGAAWQEMEKIDVQISVWLPEAVQKEAEVKLSQLTQSSVPLQTSLSPETEVLPDESLSREQEIYGQHGRSKSQEEIDGFIFTQDGRHMPHIPPREHIPHPLQSQLNPQQADLQVLLARYIQHLVQDRKNIVIFILSALVLFSASFSTTNTPAVPIQALTNPASISTILTSAFVTTETILSTSTSIMTVTSTAVETSFTTTLSLATLPAPDIQEILPNSGPMIEGFEVNDEASGHTFDDIPHTMVSTSTASTRPQEVHANSAISPYGIQVPESGEETAALE